MYFITIRLVRKIFTFYINGVLLFKFHFRGQRFKYNVCRLVLLKVHGMLETGSFSVLGGKPYRCIYLTLCGTTAIHSHCKSVTVNNFLYRTEWIHSSSQYIISGKLNSRQNPELKSYWVQGKIISSGHYTQLGLSTEGVEVGFPALIRSRKEEKMISYLLCFFPPHLLKGSCK